MLKAAKSLNMAKRIPLYIMGLITMAFGIAVVIKVDIGVAPGSAVPYSVSLLTPLTVGMCSSLFQIFCMLAQLALTRKFSPKLILQFPLAYIFGALLDAFLWLLKFETPALPYRILLTVAGLFVFSFGIRAIVGSDLIIAPTDGLARTLGEKLGWPMSKGKLLFDIIVTVTAALLTFFLAGNAFLAVNIGTVICAAGTGPIIGLFTKLFPSFDYKKPSS